MNTEYPFEWNENSKEDQEHRAKFWTGDNSIAVRSVISSPMGVNMPAIFVEDGVHLKIWNMKPRPDDIWIVTYPKCGTTMSQELLWQMSRGCNVTSEESKTNLFKRSPFLEREGLFRIPASQEDPKRLNQIEYAETLPGPRIMKCHLPVSMLPPNVLEVAKVIVVARNVKDACVSFYHHEKLLKHHGWSNSASFDDYAKFYMDGRPSACGDYWTHLKDSIKWSKSKNLLLVWYEDILKDFEGKVNEIAKFTGFKVSPEQMKVLKEHMHIDNFRKNDAVNFKPAKGTVPDDVRDNFNFIRKGKIGDWENHFTDGNTLEAFNQWIENNIKDSDGNIIDEIKYTGSQK